MPSNDELDASAMPGKARRTAEVTGRPVRGVVIGQEIISYAIRTGDVQPFLDQGWDLDWLGHREKPLHAAIFRDNEQDAWRFILRHYEKHGKVPAPDLFHLDSPQFEILDNEHTAAEIIEVARRVYLAALYAFDNDDIVRMYEADDWAAIPEMLRKLAADMDGVGGPAALPFRLLSLDDIDALPDPEILIDGLIDHGTVTKLVGESGKGKSFVAIDWSLCIATGRRWKHRNVRQGRVLYIAAEGAYGLKKRIRAWKKTYGDVPPDSLKLIPDAVQLADAGQLAALVRVARNYDVVVIDTLSRTSVGLEENSSTDMARYIDACYKIRDAAKEAGATVLVVHHTGYDTKRARGSSALFANGDGEILIESDDPHQRMTMTVKKRKDGEAGQQVHLNLETVDCGDWTSCVVREQDAPEIELSPRERVLAALTSAWQPTKDVERLTGLTNSTADRALKALVAEELAESHRAGNRTEYRLV